MRKRFHKTESYGLDEKVEWLNATTWRKGLVSSGLLIDEDGRHYYRVLNIGSTRSINHFELVRGYPGHLRKVS